MYHVALPLTALPPTYTHIHTEDDGQPARTYPQQVLPAARTCSRTAQNLAGRVLDLIRQHPGGDAHVQVWSTCDDRMRSKPSYGIRCQKALPTRLAVIELPCACHLFAVTVYHQTTQTIVPRAQRMSDSV
eukprot:358844-Chlamydomonas_euryale.AAC.4